MAFDAERFRAKSQSAELQLGAPLVYQVITGSTNDDALAAARAGATQGTLFVADEQTRGRGRRGNAWLAAPGESLLFSLVLRPELELGQVSALTLALGLAVLDAVSPTIADVPQLKWPNDLLVNRKKLAGVLVESQCQADRLEAVVVGIGLNLTTQAFPEPISASATSLALLGARELDTEALLITLLSAIAKRLEAYQRTGVRGIVQELNAVDALRDQRLRVEEYQGIGRGIDEQGRLLLESDTGTVHAITAGTVELL